MSIRLEEREALALVSLLNRARFWLEYTNPDGQREVEGLREQVESAIKTFRRREG